MSSKKPIKASGRRKVGPSRQLREGLIIATAALSGCEGIQSTLTPRGPAAESIARINWIMFWGATAILLLVMTLALYAVYRHPRKRRPISGNGMIVTGGVILPLVALSALLIYGTHGMSNLRHEPYEGALRTMRIEVVGNQWWWDVYYWIGDQGTNVITANEIHIPAGFPVAISVRSNDVIHSFWVPSLAGKIDLVPGKSNRILLQADRPGVFRGQCAEFCGAQHARMALFVVAESPHTFATWLAKQRLPDSTPVHPILQRGQDAFVANGCLECHTIRGLGKAKLRGPDLTHVGDRLFLAAGSIKNNPANLAKIIAHSQFVKPGSAMPSFTELDSDTLQSIAAYLWSLK
ncbi:cytochrome c oxidase subunit II [Nitrosococcus wardiae]|uniref:cytochrome-c oxidase n=1 Tax=Nitrosococcus wardiae TaxID=1814290 RepID=A0A4P7C226_9GAMM|nr:cytochrome c oxidase subunit II [Nitrosococcus wardiae]QBQ55717.1 cytochrome c oxidase subunit II [Nitrosococcus wardiae]